MELYGNSRLSRRAPAWFLLCSCALGTIGCNNTCVSGTLNGPSGSTVSIKAGSTPPSCSLSAASGMVQLEIGAASGTSSNPFIVAPLRPRVTHLFVTVAGVDVHSSPLAIDDTPGWQPLAASLQQHPLQVDLLAAPDANASSAPFPEASLPSGAYRQIRLRLAASPLAPEPALETSRCSTGTPHCAVFSDGRVSRLDFPVSRPDLRIVLDGAPGHELYVPPDGTVALVIELDRDRTFLWPSGDFFFLEPVFHLRVQLPANVAEN